MNALKKWWNEEPIATRTGPIIALIAGYLVYRGVIDEVTEELIIGIATLLLGGTAVVTARSKVAVLAKLADDILDRIRGRGNNED